MLKAFVVDNDRLHLVDGLAPNRDAIVWVDLFSPTREEEAQIETWLGVEVPTREEMEEIEISSRLYVENGVYFMTATLPAHTEGDEPIISPVTAEASSERRMTNETVRPAAAPKPSAEKITT